MKPPQFSKLPVRFWDKVEIQDSGCWEWQGSTNLGYGKYSHEGSMRRAHRLAAEDYHGSIPKGAHVLHHCDVRVCIKREHLYFGTPADNSADMVRRNRQARGTANGAARLTEESVPIIRELGEALSARRIAVRYGVNKATIIRILRGDTWSHV